MVFDWLRPVYFQGDFENYKHQFFFSPSSLSIFICLGVLKTSRFDQKNLFQKIYLVQFDENGKSRDQIFPPGFDPEATQAVFISFFLYFSLKSKTERF